MEAPFNHVHDQGTGADHHTREAAHIHLRHHSVESHGPALQQLDPADDERLVTWFQTIEQGRQTLYVAPEISQFRVANTINEFERPTPSVRNHDPPFDPAVPSRAPPIASV
jgi:hypothetical protein